MTQDPAPSGTTERDGLVVGPLRRSVNSARNVRGSIHDDETAGKLGFRGGTVAGSIHMDLFPPLLLRGFGRRWFERGSLSLYFTNATTDREPVRASLTLPPAGAEAAQVDVWIEREDGMRVAEGTAAAGECAELTALHRRPLARFEAGELRMLCDVHPGDALDPVTVRIPHDEQVARQPIITEPLDWYIGPSPWGGSPLSPALTVRLLYAKSVETLRPKLGPAVGLFGAIEIANVNGPLRTDTDYTVTGRVVAVGQSPKTEYMWFDTAAHDRKGTPIATMRMLLRWMKASSARYHEA